MTSQKRDLAPWLLLPSVVLALGSVTLLAPHQAALAAPPAPVQPAPSAPAYDDGDGDELLEHWGDPKYLREERVQLGGIAVGFLVLGAINACRRPRRTLPGEVVFLPSEDDFLSESDFPKRNPSTSADFRKAA